MTHHSPRRNAIAPRDASSAARRNAGVSIVAAGNGLPKQLNAAH